MLSYQYRKSHCGDKTILRSSYLHNGISYTGKMTSLYWIKLRVLFQYWGYLLCIGIPSIKIRQSWDHFIIIMESLCWWCDIFILRWSPDVQQINQHKTSYWSIVTCYILCEAKVSQGSLYTSTQHEPHVCLVGSKQGQWLLLSGKISPSCSPAWVHTGTRLSLLFTFIIDLWSFNSLWYLVRSFWTILKTGSFWKLTFFF